MEDTVYPDAKVIDASRNFVNVIGHREDEHGTRDVVVNKEKMTVCKVYGSIACEVHKQGFSNTNKFFSGNFKTPTTIFCDPSGKELSRKEGGLSITEQVKLMGEALKRVSGDHIALGSWKSAKQLMTDGDAYLKDGNYKKALELYAKVAKMTGRGLVNMGKEGIQKIEAEGDAKIKEALEVEDPASKKEALKKIAEDFKGTETEKKARKEIENLK